MARLTEQDRPPDAGERALLAGWSGWGAVPQLFDEHRPGWGPRRDRLRELVGDDGFASARRTTVNAHYTHPAIAREIWRLAGELGFEQGRVLEPGCGAGVFIGTAPPGAQITGVERDDMTATIAQLLYPDAQIIARSFAAADRTPDGSYDLVIGNVPFADVRLHDPRHNPHGHAIHNHFIVKSLHLTRPGGLVLVLSSRFTLDAANPAARREIAGLADLLGAVRLPAGAHRRAAGTDAVTDLLVLRRRAPDTEPADPDWVTTQLLDVDGVQQRVGRPFITHPERVLGELHTAPRGMYGSQELTVTGLTEIPELCSALRAQGDRITAAARQTGLTFAATAATAVTPSVTSAAPGGDEELWDGHLAAHADGSFTEVQDGVARPFSAPRGVAAELRLLLGIRDQARRVLQIEAETIDDTPLLDGLRSALRDSYTTYLARYGPINRYQLRRTGRHDPDTGEPRMARLTPPAIRTLAGDPFGALVISLELFDDATQSAEPAAILSRRVLVARQAALGADNPQDALAICLDTHGRVELDHIAELLGASTDQAREQLGEQVYEDPGSGRLVPAAEYLSGDVRVKLDEARAVTDTRPELAVNVTALERVLPPELTPEEIEPRLGAAWVDVDTHQQFFRELLDDPDLTVENPGASIWGVEGNNRSLKATSQWGTSRLPAPRLARTVLEQRPVQVTDEIEGGGRVVNPVETAAAQDKANALQERFAEWLWADPDRSTRLTDEYNRRFNSIALRSYDHDGRRLSLPGLAQSFAPRDHQRTAVARMLSEPAVGLFHEVGAGKTAEMVIGAMELRRLGMVAKPCVVVPNHMLEQFTREWLQLYPQARLLAAATSDLEGDKRRRFVSRAATNDWDAILMTRTAFERIPMSADSVERYEREQITELRTMLDSAKGGKGLTVKRLEKAVMRREEQLRRKLDSPKDTVVSFEQSGIDYLIVDEAHGYKNLETLSSIPDAAIDGAKRATDLHLKLEWLRSRHGERVVTMATATPIANSVTEAHVMARYLRPDLLQAAGVLTFDRWAATFGRTVTEIEMAPTGGGDYRMKTRFAAFQNVPEMLRSWHVFADVRTGEDLQLPRPQITRRPDGERAPQTVVVPASEAVRAYIAVLGQRAEAVRSRAVDPTEDNMLKISGDGRKAALDMRLVDPASAPVPGAHKLQLAAERIATIHHRHADDVFDDAVSGQPSLLPGALQIVFCDLGTPGGDEHRFQVYGELRDLLTAEGVPAARIRFIHEARNDREKARLFEACRTGEVSVIVGSTEKMGVGTNIQARAVALHHLDCPWRPADIEQRDGRILRQGNQNPEVSIFRYVVEQSFDAYSWQTVERKAKFISQVMKGRLDGRTVSDIGDTALSFAEVKALASGDPLILELAQASNELERLSRLQRAWQHSRQGLRDRRTAAEQIAEARGRDHALVTDAIPRTVSTRGERFQMTIAGQTTDERVQAGELLTDYLQRLPRGQARPVGELGGHPLSGQARQHDGTGEPELMVWLTGIPRQDPAHASLEHARANPLSLIRQLEHRVEDLSALADRLAEDRERALADDRQARETLAQPFKHAAELADAKATVAAVKDQMQQAERRRAAEQHQTEAGAEPEPAAPAAPTGIDPHAGAPAYRAAWRQPVRGHDGLGR